jgi:F0F1-type ATP synthase membrane subunit b/b'
MTFLALAGNVQLIPDGSLLIHIGMILLMIWILNRTFFRPIHNVIEAREGKKGGSKGPAGEILEQVADKQATYESEIRKTRLAGYQLIEGEREGALSVKQVAVQNAKHEVAEKLAKEIGDIDRAAKVAKEEIEREADKLADKITATILR